jgi:hypothetical protein
MLMQRPRLKMSAPMLRAGGELHIVGQQDVTSLPDPDGALHRLFELADGSRSTSELHDELITEYPRLGEDYIVDAICELESAGLYGNSSLRLRVAG